MEIEKIDLEDGNLESMGDNGEGLESARQEKVIRENG